LSPRTIPASPPRRNVRLRSAAVGGLEEASGRAPCVGLGRGVPLLAGRRGSELAYGEATEDVRPKPSAWGRAEGGCDGEAVGGGVSRRAGGGGGATDEHSEGRARTARRTCAAAPGRVRDDTPVPRLGGADMTTRRWCPGSRGRRPPAEASASPRAAGRSTRLYSPVSGHFKILGRRAALGTIARRHVPRGHPRGGGGARAPE
jgi:hypothetical protein